MTTSLPRDASTPELLTDLCRLFWQLGWASGTGGGISIRDEEGIWIAPSGVQKERILPEDLFLLDASSLDEPRILRQPKDSALRCSECTPLFLSAYRQRGAGAVLHSHSPWAVLATRIFSHGNQGGLFETEGLEMQKGLRGKGCFERVKVPIIPNTARESELTQSLSAAIDRHPDVDAVMVANHGVYIWGRDWVQAKTQAECYDYLFRLAVESYRLGVPLIDSHKAADAKT